MRLTISASASVSSQQRRVQRRTSSFHASTAISDSVAPAGLGYSATTPPEALESRKKASPIGIRNDAQRSSGRSKSSSQTVRVPVGRSSASPPRSATQLSQAQRMWRSTRCSRWRWSGASCLPHRSQRSTGPRPAAPPGSPPRPGQPAKAGDHVGLTARRDAASSVSLTAQRHPRRAGAGEQRHRLQQQPVVVERAARRAGGRSGARSSRSASVPSSSFASPSDAPQPAQASRKASSLPSARATASASPRPRSAANASPASRLDAVDLDPRRRRLCAAGGDLDDWELGARRARRPGAPRPRPRPRGPRGPGPPRRAPS